MVVGENLPDKVLHNEKSITSNKEVISIVVMKVTKTLITYRRTRNRA